MEPEGQTAAVSSVSSVSSGANEEQQQRLPSLSPRPLLGVYIN